MADIEAMRFAKVHSKINWPKIVDITVVISVIVFISVSEFGWFPHFIKRGFYCDDRTIQRPYKGDTVTIAVIILSGFVPLFLIWFTEALFYSPTAMECTKIDSSNSRCLDSWYNTWHWFKKYGRGLLIKLLLVDIMKIFSGEHRPHFLDTCKPNVICEGSEYVSSYICTNTVDNQYFIRDASKSFPSGHSSLSVYQAIFVIWYLQKRIPNIKSTMALPLAQFLLATWAVFCSLSRIADNRHHWWDVLAGAIIGVIAAGLTCFISCNNFDRFKRESNYKVHNDNLMGSVAHYKEDNLPGIVNSI
ncbi:phospholipid phosphatase 1-like isoform X2 [Toxorhynchites rutilus septentrionalis]|uniref:phospholipid phosphatase 1-like isoform X2 n=1 Tax=Toxorhynchites rutilus septentrionalis TaxID=329112 RepID=UPI002479B6F9|nr:phospholipid phosphatase 1-like isoform X2 [Toxorhynchites rutilus septentrionalis]